MKINDRVRYDEQNAALGDVVGTVVEPTEEEVGEVARWGIEPSVNLMIAWDDGQRFWEDPASLVEVNE